VVVVAVEPKLEGWKRCQVLTLEQAMRCCVVQGTLASLSLVHLPSQAEGSRPGNVPEMPHSLSGVHSL
jgi:hypothetical protein